MYYQNHLACPDWDAIGLSFPGVPGLPHFGHTARVAWCVTHGMADYQDLYIERFDASGSEPLRVPRRVAGGRRPAGDASRCAATRPSRSRPWRPITGPWWPASRAMAMPSPARTPPSRGPTPRSTPRAHAARAERAVSSRRPCARGSSPSITSSSPTSTATSAIARAATCRCARWPMPGCRCRAGRASTSGAA